MADRAGEMVISRFNCFEHKITVMMARHQFVITLRTTRSTYRTPYARRFVFSFRFEEAIIEISIVRFNSFWMPTKRISTHTILAFQFWHWKYTLCANTQRLAIAQFSEILWIWNVPSSAVDGRHIAIEQLEKLNKSWRKCRAPIECMIRLWNFCLFREFRKLRIKLGNRVFRA